VDQPLPSRWTRFQNLPNPPEVSVFPDRAPRLHHRHADESFKLRCPACDYALRGLPGDYCPECGLDLAYEPINVFTAHDLSLVWAAGLLLDREEISNLIVTGGSDILQGMGLSFSGRPRLMVPFKFFSEAVELLDREMGGRDFAAGMRPEAPPAGPPWRCEGCQERNPGSFELCWSCGRVRST
jgi:hypothetical protein